MEKNDELPGNEETPGNEKPAFIHAEVKLEYKGKWVRESRRRNMKLVEYLRSIPDRPQAQVIEEALRDHREKHSGGN